MITTLLFDLGGTLHTCRSTPAMTSAFSAYLWERLSDYGIVLGCTPEELYAYLKTQALLYKTESEKTLTELPAVRIWNEYYLARFHIGEAKLAPIAEELSFVYDYLRLKIMRRPRLKETVEELSQMGIRLGVISNIISTSLVPHMLNEYGIGHLMETVVMSSEAGIRKPDKRIFDMALRNMGVTAAETGYVGDTLSRDVLGSRNAGLGLSVLIENPSLAARDRALVGDNPPVPDFVIKELWELPAIIRQINEKG